PSRRTQRSGRRSRSTSSPRATHRLRGLAGKPPSCPLGLLRLQEVLGAVSAPEPVADLSICEANSRLAKVRVKLARKAGAQVTKGSVSCPSSDSAICTMAEKNSSEESACLSGESEA